MYRLLESIRVEDGVANNLEGHCARVRHSCQELFGKSPSWNLNDMIERGALQKGLLKLRVTYDLHKAEAFTERYTIKPVNSLKLVDVGELTYAHKFEDRNELMRYFNLRDACDNVLMIKKGFVTDTSYTNIVFSRGTKWFTPDTFLLNGTMRQLLIRTGVVEPIPITVKELNSFDQFRLINAMLRMDAPPSDVSNIS